MEPYSVACIQHLIRHAPDPETAPEVRRENVHRSIAMIHYCAIRFGRPKLALCPEWYITGAAHTRDIATWQRVAIQIPGPETELLSRCAQEMNLYIGGGSMEYDPLWPGCFFNSAFLIAPNGDVALKYRKHNGAPQQGHSNYTCPGDLYTRYLEKHGPDPFFPVVDTPLGRIGMMVCYDVNFPEVPRCLALHGAEIILHPTGEPHSGHREPWENARRTRAYENRVYVLSANHGAYAGPIDGGGYTDSPFPAFREYPDPHTETAPLFRSRGHSEVVDYQGRVLAVADGPGEAVITATLNIEQLRYHRSQPEMNFLAQSRWSLYPTEYTRACGFPNDGFLDEPFHSGEQARRLTRGVIEARHRAGIAPRPDNDAYVIE